MLQYKPWVTSRAEYPIEPLGINRLSRPMINKPLPFKGLDIRIPILFPIKGRGFINQGSMLSRNPVSPVPT